MTYRMPDAEKHFDLWAFKTLVDAHNLDTRLLEASSSAIRRSLAAPEDWSEMTRWAGQALEWLAKAAIYRHAPGTLPHKGPESAPGRALAGEPNGALFGLADVLTHPATASIRQAYEAWGLEAPTTDDLIERVVSARNSATHLDFVSPLNACRAGHNAAILAAPLLRIFDQTIESWIESPELIEVWKAAGLRDAPRVPRPEWEPSDPFPQPDHSVVAWARLYRARVAWVDLSERLPTAVMETLTTNPGSAPEEFEHPELVPCPTGGHLTWAEVDEEVNGDWYEDDPEESCRYDLFRSHLTCKLCGLAVETHEIEVLGLGEVIGERLREEDGTVTDTYF
jgi:hypothetical protein